MDENHDLLRIIAPSRNELYSASYPAMVNPEGRIGVSAVLSLPVLPVGVDSPGASQSI
jgi:hypothetical protein